MPTWICPAELADAISGRRGKLRESLGAAERIVAPSDPDERIADLGLESEVELGGGCERGGALEETHDGAVVLTQARPVGGAS